MARPAFAHTAAYDAAIVAWLDAGGPGPVTTAEADQQALAEERALAAVLPPTLHLALGGARGSVTGEPAPSAVRATAPPVRRNGGTTCSSTAARSSSTSTCSTATRRGIVHELARDADRPAVAIIKHANPCGAAVADDLVTAYERALECDVQSAFGGVVAAIGGVVTEALADAVAAGPQADVIIAASYEPAALEKLTTCRKATRLLSGPAPEQAVRQLRSLGSSVLVQDIDTFVVPGPTGAS